MQQTKGEQTQDWGAERMTRKRGRKVRTEKTKSGVIPSILALYFKHCLEDIFRCMFDEFFSKVTAVCKNMTDWSRHVYDWYAKSVALKWLTSTWANVTGSGGLVAAALGSTSSYGTNDAKALTFSRTTQVSQYQKGKPIWILLKQETVSSNGVSWAICKSAPRSRQTTTPAPHQSFFTGRMPFLPPNQQRQSTEGKALKETQNTTGVIVISGLG